MTYQIGTSKLTVGQEVGIRSGYGNNRDSLGWFVKAITPKSGVATVGRADGSHLRRFNKDGYELGTTASKYYKDVLVDADLARARKAQEEREEAAYRALLAVAQVVPPGLKSVHAGSASDLLAQLDDKMTAAREAVAALLLNAKEGA